MRDYGFTGDVSVPGQNRLTDVYMGCPGCKPVAGLRGAIPSGSYMGAIGRTISMNGLGTTHLSSTGRAGRELAQLGIGRPPSVVATMGLGDGTRDRQMCQASFQAGQAGVGVATQYHTQSAGSGTPDQGWTTALGISNALMTVGGAFCNFIDTGAPTSPTGQPYTPQQLYQNTPPPSPAAPPWLLIGGVGVGALVLGYLVFGK